MRAAQRSFLARLVALALVIALSGCSYSLLQFVPRYQAEVFQGVSYYHETRTDPRLMSIHIVKIDLRAPGISFFVTPGDPQQEYPLRLQTTSSFLEKYGLQVAINGSYFWTEETNRLFDLFYSIGEPAQIVGYSASNGVTYGTLNTRQSAIYIMPNNRVHIGSPVNGAQHVLSGGRMLMLDGQTFWYPSQPEPRTAVGVDYSGRTLILAVVDGRQPGYSEGIKLAELVALMVEYGAWTAIYLDGGGSTTMAMQAPDGTPLVMNSPIGNKVAGYERPVANHLGVYAPPLP